MELEGKETKEIDGKPYVFQKAIRGDVALIRAWKGDTAGNLQYRMTEQNFNKGMATAADLVIAEVLQIVPVGELDPNAIYIQGNYVDYLGEAHTTLEEQAALPPASITSTAR
jgi:3-oxoacid CoA-transferase